MTVVVSVLWWRGNRCRWRCSGGVVASIAGVVEFTHLHWDREMALAVGQVLLVLALALGIGDTKRRCPKGLVQVQ